MAKLDELHILNAENFDRLTHAINDAQAEQRTIVLLKDAEIARLQAIIDDLQQGGENPDPEPSEFDFYISPNGTGDGTSEEKATAISRINELIKKAGPGGKIALIANQGPYTVNSINIDSGGTAANPVTIMGLHGHAQFVGNRNAGVPDFNSGRDVGDGTTIWKRPWQKPANVEGWQPINAASWGSNGNELFRLLEGANNLIFSKIDPIRRQKAYNMIGNVKNIIIEYHDFFNVDHGVYSAYDSPNGWEDLYVMNCTATGISNDFVRGTGACKNTIIEDVVADSGFQIGGKFIMVFFFSEQCDGVTIRRTIAKNGLDTGGFDDGYANGDGFVFEREVKNVYLEDCHAEHFSDGGFDTKSHNTKLLRCSAKWCKKSFRLWNGGELTACESIEPRKTVVKNKNWHGGSGIVSDLEMHGGKDSANPNKVTLIRSPTVEHVVQVKHSVADKFYGQLVRVE